MKKPFYKKWWFWLIVVIIVVGAIGSGGESKDSGKEISKTSPTSKQTSKTASAEKTEEAETYKIGDDVKVGKINVIINKCDEKKEFKSNNRFMKNVNTEGKFIAIDAKITNNDSEARTIDTNMFKIVDSKNREFEVYSKAELMMILGDKYLFLESVNPGMNRAGTFVFEVPADVNQYSLKVYPGIMFKTGDPKVIKLK